MNTLLFKVESNYAFWSFMKYFRNFKLIPLFKILKILHFYLQTALFHKALLLEKTNYTHKT